MTWVFSGISRARASGHRGSDASQAKDRRLGCVPTLAELLLRHLASIDSSLIGHGSSSTAVVASTSIADSLNSFVEAAGQFFSDLAAVHWGTLLLGLAFFGLN